LFEGRPDEFVIPAFAGMTIDASTRLSLAANPGHTRAGGVFDNSIPLNGVPFTGAIFLLTFVRAASINNCRLAGPVVKAVRILFPGL
jgi:hypothetical protein